MGAKDFLKQLRLCEIHIQRKIEDKAKIEAVATKITPSYSADVVQHGDSDKIGNAVIKIVEIEEELDKEIDKYRKIRKDITEVVELIHEADYVTVIYKRYFEYKRFEKIAEEMNVSKVWVMKLHSRALTAVDVILSQRVY